MLAGVITILQCMIYFILSFFFNASGQQFRGGASEQEFGTGDLRARIRHHKWGGANVQTKEIK